MSSSSRASLITIAVTLALGALVALAGSQGGVALGAAPLFALAVAAAFAVQVIVFVPSVLGRTERFFDLTGGGTFFLVTVGLLALAPQPDARSWVLAGMVSLWAVRLALFLFLRIHRSGADDRFDEIKQSPLRFLRVWIVQGAWVAITASAAWIAMSSPVREPLGWLSFVGIAVWALGFGVEVIADAQKSAFAADPAHRGRFISTGLWSRSRHPNYFGEILLWIGVFLVAAPVLQGWQWIAVLSPMFVILLLTRVSGIPLLEAKAQRRWGGQDDYEAYTSRTPVLIPRLF